MSTFTPVIFLLVIAAVDWVVVKLGAKALALTGLSKDAAHFQSMSAFFGVGFTTREAELVTADHRRRQIVQWLILAGNLGVVGTLGTVVIAFVRADSPSRMAIWLLPAAALFVLIVRSKTVEKWLDRVLEYFLKHTEVGHHDPLLLLRVDKGFGVREFCVTKEHVLCGKPVAEIQKLSRELLVLGITKSNGSYIGAPSGKTIVNRGDILAVYGRDDHVAEIADAHADQK